MAPKTARGSSDDAVNERLKSVEETLANITQTMQQMIPDNQKNVYKDAIIQRFGTEFDDPMSELKNVKYETNAKAYQDAF
ncbi:hypothetical protein Tco_0640220 [Tanacetum coccineum]